MNAIERLTNERGIRARAFGETHDEVRKIDGVLAWGDEAIAENALAALEKSNGGAARRIGLAQIAEELRDEAIKNAPVPVIEITSTLQAGAHTREQAAYYTVSGRVAFVLRPDSQAAVIHLPANGSVDGIRAQLQAAVNFLNTTPADFLVAPGCAAQQTNSLIAAAALRVAKGAAK